MKKILGYVLALAVVGCGDKSSSDPDTNDLGEFNPPGQLASLTRDSALELTWVGANAEDDFQGYHVFGTTTSLSDLQALVKYPDGASILSSQSIPRCVDNNDFFKKFGFPDTDVECESSVIPEEDDDGLFLTGDNMGYIMQDDEGSKEEEEEEEELTIDFNIPCTGEGQTVEDGSVSLAPASEGKTLGRAFCEVKKVHNGTKLVDIENGTTYSYLVVAVKGSDKNEISWISNVVADTPADELFSDQITLKGGSTNAQYAAFAVDATDFDSTDSPDPQDCSDHADANFCKIDDVNQDASVALYIARDASTSTNFKFSQRLFVSAPKNSAIELQFRGPQVWDDPREENTILPQTPGDEASSGTYDNNGTKFAVNEHAVFDFRYDLGDGTFRYGKIAITNLSYEDDEDKESDVTLDVTIVLQRQIDQHHYFAPTSH